MPTIVDAGCWITLRKAKWSRSVPIELVLPLLKTALT